MATESTPFPPLVEPGPELSREERERFARHLILAGFGPEAQRRVRAAHVLVIGAGGLGSPICLYLAAAGIGRITVVDDDVVEVSNLHRQVIHGASTVGCAKAESAAQRIADLSDLVSVRPLVTRIDPSNALELVSNCDVVVDGSDNFATRYLVADACEIAGVPLVWGTLDRFRAQFSVFWSRPPQGYEAIGLRDLYPEPPAPGTVPSCGEAGVLGALTGQVGSLLALQVLWLITGVAAPVLGRLVLVDSLATTQRSFRIRADPNRKPVIDLSGTSGVSEPRGAAACSDSGSARGAAADAIKEVDVTTVAQELAQTESSPVLVDVREAGERAVACIEPSLWVPLGTIDEALADPTSALRRELAGDRTVVVYCKAGGRSAQAVARIQAAMGSARTADICSLRGGIDAWTARVDPTLPRY